MKENALLNELLNPGLHQGNPEFMIVTDQLSERLVFTCNFIFRKVFQSPYQIALSSDELKTHTGPIINYSGRSIPSSFRIPVEGLLFENGLRKNSTELVEVKPLLRAFVCGTANPGFQIEYDLFSMVFYFISRYEEWQDHNKDEHGRFTVRNSILFRYGLQQRPLIDLCVQEFRSELEKHFQGLHLYRKKAGLLSTIDVDNVYAYRHKSFLRVAGAGFKDLLKGDFYGLGRRLAVLRGKISDPFDIYDTVSEFCARHNIPLVFFFLMRSGTRYDRSLDPDSGAFQEIISRLNDYPLSIGLHPSYETLNDQEQLGKETRRMTEVLNAVPIFSRQHFLRFDVRRTPHMLSQKGFRADFSMGYSDVPGFRAGTSFVFNYYDFERERETDFKLVPFCLMDGAYSIHTKRTQDEILATVDEMANDIESSGGNFVSVYHERSFDDHLYPGFGTLYREMHLRLKARFTS
ncbi:MAG TPA: polysaccharide deacetylase family protein [Bacteroidia bacterium]|nr:polysaccharide deacetylase family protein [Bacteroidia bacterium]